MAEQPREPIAESPKSERSNKMTEQPPTMQAELPEDFSLQESPVEGPQPRPKRDTVLQLEAAMQSCRDTFGPGQLSSPLLDHERTSSPISDPGNWPASTRDSEQLVTAISDPEKSDLERETRGMLGSMDEKKEKKRSGQFFAPIDTTPARPGLPASEPARFRTFYEPNLQRKPLAARSHSQNPTIRLERDTLAMLEGSHDRPDSNELGPLSPAPSSINESIDWGAPPPYEQSFEDTNGHISTSILDNGRISMIFRGRSRRFTSLPPLPEFEPEAEQTRQKAANSYPLLNIVIQVVGSRGDVQPFIALGQELQVVGHRVRLATHDTFEEFVKKSGLEFFPIGGDPTELMAYMVKNPGIIPKFSTIRAGEISKKRKMVNEMLEGCWKSCTQPDPATNIPFVAEAIIANPPSFAHVHCAQALGIPVHLMFTMPWSATRMFPHPLANVSVTDTDPTITNFLSYSLVDLMTWQGLGDVINHWRRKTLNLEPFSTKTGAGLLGDLNVPFTYCWSPALIPKPIDWPAHIDVCGFFFRAPPDYTPFPELDEFLKAGPPPIYIGFGSIVMENAEKMTQTIIGAVKACGQRAIVSQGWSKLGKDVAPDPDFLFIGDCPHEWLFKHVSAVIHHGGAGTTACGLLNGRPTAIVPFFGDQPFWANMVAVAGAGPRPIEHKSLNVESLSKAIKICVDPATVLAAEKIALKMKYEKGVQAAVTSFHRNLPIHHITCDLVPDHPANWDWKKGKRSLKLSHRAAAILVDNKKIDAASLKLHHSKPIVIENRRYDPVSAVASTGVDSIKNIYLAIEDTALTPMKEYRKVTGLNEKEPETSSLHSNTSHRSAAGAAGKAVGRGFGKVGLALTKTMVDIPVAAANGLQSVPEVYGCKSRDYGAITGWKSGAKVGMKSLGYGFYDGFAGFANESYKGAKRSGVKGMVIGIAQGTAHHMTQPLHGLVGVIAYPALGLYRNLVPSSVTGVQRDILQAQQAYGIWLAENKPVAQQEVDRIIKSFEERMKVKESAQYRIRPVDIVRAMMRN
ncbi:hypothetical protein LZ554_002830 [Drepanopeziza brunnea f. sp. 'monogermtubi']|nr:hypothetical protein LZ554_002830 [Drepanopeziza brunnea f. sp. 'monogermtubi']